jgi:phage terminase large subunit
MNNDFITTGPNYPFIIETFTQAKKALKHEQENHSVLHDRLQGIGLEGASRSGKSWDTSIFICQYVTKYTGKTIVIARDWLATLKTTNYLTLKKVWALFGLPTNVFNKSATNIEYNGNTIIFIGVNDDVEKAKGLESNLLWLNEGLSMNHEAVNQLIQRCVEFYVIDYNPSDLEHFLYDMELQPGHKVLKTCVFDNPYAPRNSVKKILSYAHPEIDDFDFLKYKPLFKERFKTLEQWNQFKQDNLMLKSANAYSWEVYGLGKRAVGEDRIFEDWDTYKDEPNDYDWKVYGGDFGYINDPTAMVQVIKSGNNLFIKQLIFETGLLNNQIAERINQNGWNDVNSCWDKAEQKSIAELQVLGVPAWGPDKGAGSIAWGIQKIKQFKLHIHEDSKDILKELPLQKWAKDKQGNYKRNSLGQRIPVDKDNHSIDAIRYALSFYRE